ncbi:rhamnogalacturonan acetylesterase [Caulobacter sp. UNC279MFTsu5.1]|uniref:rhamnogalacturonan acetylesterase n=1 Tax=Caulobacter sp. UNC279MFTsu5.1 TaxID=1502775 RepID=UPI0008F39799|nr:rhamnogalacturonan acetylesterase [Caulobacter sp. UNC279MFTsu5.1]SFJ98368.1 Lysophospholipase L1 [Caulobacter sp. UNC279MFTsu5.1]
MWHRRAVLAALAAAPTASWAVEAEKLMPGWAFDFGDDKPAPGYVRVARDAAYDPAVGHGFEPSPAPLSSGGPFLFSLAAPEGDYRVTLALGGEAASDTTVKAESRRLMAERIVAKAGGTATVTFVVNVRNATLTPPPPNAPGGVRVLLNPREEGSYDWDDKLTLEFCGPAPAVRRLRVEPVTVPVVYLAGDSTVTDQRFEPGASWGQMLPRFFKPDVSVANHAESGETLKAFLVERRLDKLLSRIKPGDWLLIQFGHNDQKIQWPQTYVEAATTYRDYLKAYVGEARRRGARPVLVTSMHRRRFNAAGRIVNTLGDYPEAVRAVGRETGVPVIDLLDMSAALYEALGPNNAWKAFADGGKDVTHHNNYGAYMLAQCVVSGIRAQVPDLAAHLVDDLPSFDPAHPPSPDGFVLAPSAAHSSEAPRGN